MILKSFRGKTPQLGQRVYVSENAAVIGDVVIGDDSSVWFGTTVRGDCHWIRIGSRTNVQDNCTIHVTTGTHPTVIGDEVTIGHGAIVHGCTIERGALIGMGAIVLDAAVVGEGALVAAGAVVSEGMHVPPRTLVAGVPAKVKRPLTPEECARVDEGWQHYVEYKDEYLKG
jgi:carbonic anhydrase/acetyltransferase-like protein (isoleucine patch superfamily)